MAGGDGAGSSVRGKNHLYILWTNDNKLTAEKMVFMYAVNSRLRNWWEQVTIIIWGATAQLVADDVEIQDLAAGALSAGVQLSACKACCDQLGITEKIEGLGIEVILWGQPLTEILKSGETLISL